MDKVSHILYTTHTIMYTYACASVNINSLSGIWNLAFILEENTFRIYICISIYEGKQRISFVNDEFYFTNVQFI